MKKRDKNAAKQLFFYKFGVKIQKLDFNAPLMVNTANILVHPNEK